MPRLARYTARMGFLRLVLVLVVALSISEMGLRADMEKKATAVVFADKAHSTPIFDILSYPARIVPKVNTNILAETDGVVSKIYAPLGQKVSRRQRILAISHTDPVYQYAPLVVISPVGGIVSDVEVTEGTQVAKGDKLASVTDPNQVRITLEVPAMDVSSLQKGMEGEFKISLQEQSVPVRIRGISPFINSTTGTATCEIEFEKPLEGHFLPGLVGQVTFKANTHQGISIPEFAVFYRGSEPFVRVVLEGKAHQIAVVLGKRNRGNVEVLKGVKDGDLVVQRTSRFVGDGEAVSVQ